MKFYEHCKIDCSGGCGDCAPDDHAFYEWSEKYGYDQHQHDIAEAAFGAGFSAAVEYLKAINNEKAV